MNIKELDQFSIKDDVRQKIIEIMKGELPCKEVHAIEEYINSLDKQQYLKIIETIFRVAKEANFPINKTGAGKGVISVANWFGKTLKNLQFKYSKKSMVIVAEGDSWFEHLFIKDIISHLINITENPIYTLAFAGDWMGNYLHSQKYLKALKKYKAKVFLLSGGGNDLVDGCRLKNLVRSFNSVDNTINESDQNLIAACKEKFGEAMAKKIAIGRKYLNKEFWGVINVFAFQYLLIIRSIENEASLKGIKIITQGYDFVIPSNKKDTLIRRFFGHGNWLYNPLVQKGILSEYIRHSIACAIIFEFNEMLIHISDAKEMVYHIDCRGIASENDWVDELHLKSNIYEKIALAIEQCINSTDDTRKVYFLKDLEA